MLKQKIVNCYYRVRMLRYAQQLFIYKTVKPKDFPPPEAPLQAFQFTWWKRYEASCCKIRDGRFAHCCIFLRAPSSLLPRFYCSAMSTINTGTRKTRPQSIFIAWPESARITRATLLQTAGMY